MDRIHYGVHTELEAAADEILRQAVSNLPRRDKMDILTPWKERDRLSREIYTGDGFPDPAIRRGMYHRAWNPQHSYLNSRDGHFSGSRTDEVNIYISREGYQDSAGKLIQGWVQRPLSDCQVIRWGNQMRLQCVPCRRFVSGGGDITQCKRCRTTYIREEVHV